ncbi:MAG: hypothetical protein SGBAC_004428 [Bacillariaceae sp.]
MYRDPNSGMMDGKDKDINRTISDDNALSLFMRDLQISPSFTIVMDNPRARTSPQMIFKKAKSEGKGSTRWHATADDTMSSSSLGKVSKSASAAPAKKKKLRRKLKSRAKRSSDDEEETDSRRTPSRSSSFDASSISNDLVRQRRLSRSYSDHLTATSASEDIQPPTLPQRRLSRDVDKAPKMAVRKASAPTDSFVSKTNARMPTRRNTSRSPSRSPTPSPERGNKAFLDRGVLE